MNGPTQHNGDTTPAKLLLHRVKMQIGSLSGGEIKYYAKPQNTQLSQTFLMHLPSIRKATQMLY